MDGIILAAKGNVSDVSSVDPGEMAGERNCSLGEVHNKGHLIDGLRLGAAYPRIRQFAIA